MGCIKNSKKAKNLTFGDVFVPFWPVLPEKQCIAHNSVFALKCCVSVGSCVFQDTLDAVENLIKKHEAFEKAAATQEERFAALEKPTTVSKISAFSLCVHSVVCGRCIVRCDCI